MRPPAAERPRRSARSRRAYLINGERGRGTLEFRLGSHVYWLCTSDPTATCPSASAPARRGGRSTDETAREFERRLLAAFAASTATGDHSRTSAVDLDATSEDGRDRGRNRPRCDAPGNAGLTATGTAPKEAIMIRVSGVRVPPPVPRFCVDSTPCARKPTRCSTCAITSSTYFVSYGSRPWFHASQAFAELR
jgi:hypothetical protein